MALVGIVLVGLAGMSKEKELPEAEKKAAVAEFDFKKGMAVAVFSGTDQRRHGLRSAERR